MFWFFALVFSCNFKVFVVPRMLPSGSIAAVKKGKEGWRHPEVPEGERG